MSTTKKNIQTKFNWKNTIYVSGPMINYSVSCPTQIYDKVVETATIRASNRSQATTYLIRMGLVYLEYLEEQELENARK